MARSDLAMPEGLDEHGVRAWQTILAHLGVHTDCANDAGLAAACGCTRKVHTGGCRAFYSPAEWREHDSRYGAGCHLIVVYEGSGLHRHMSFDGYDYPAVESLQEALRAVGLLSQECTTYFAAVYLDNDRDWQWPNPKAAEDGWKEVP